MVVVVVVRAEGWWSGRRKRGIILSQYPTTLLLYYRLQDKRLTLPTLLKVKKRPLHNLSLFRASMDHHIILIVTIACLYVCMYSTYVWYPYLNDR